MLLLLIGLAVFFAPHVLTMLREPRAGLVARLGPGAYKAAYSLVSLAGLVLVVLGWQAAPFIGVWEPPAAMRHIAALLVLIAFILLAAAYLPAGRIAAKAKHPMLAAVKIWAFAHLLANGDLASIILFGSFLAYAVVDRIAAKRRGAPVPVAGPARNDLVALAVGTVAYLAFGLYLHRVLIGVPVFGA